MATDDYGQSITIPALTDPPNIATLSATLQLILKRSVLSFASASARNAALVSPTEGMTAWLQDTNTMTVYDGSSWMSESKLIMDWTPLSSIGTYATNFSAGTMAPRMRKISILGTEVWEFEGRIAATAWPASTTTTLFTLNSGYRPASEREYSVGGAQSGHYPIRLGINSNGTITGSTPSLAGTSTSVIWLDGIRITNPSL